MKLVIAGSRDLTITMVKLTELVQHCCPEGVDTIVSGHCAGIDKLGEDYAALNRLELKLFPADWKTNGKAAGPIRNAQMAKFADCALIIVNKDDSKGSLNMKACMENLGKPVHLVKLTI